MRLTNYPPSGFIGFPKLSGSSNWVGFRGWNCAKHHTRVSNTQRVVSSKIPEITNKSQMTHIFHPTYRPDIDGLRAVAILSVLGFHVFPDFFRGGFIGVDIFFVISGFLISSIIFRSLEAGSFTYTEFYIRRIRRIFPALIAVLATTFVIGYFVLLPDEFKSLGKHILGGSLFVSNLVLWGESGYFDTASELKPLLNLWSLGVEEQYYILWPLLVALTWKRSRSFPTVVLTILICSFMLNLFVFNSHSPGTFYSPVTRFWELMVGGLLAYVTVHNIRLTPPGLRPDAISWFGLFLLLLGFFMIDSRRVIPSCWTLLPTMGTFLIIHGGASAFVNSFFLSNRILVLIGLISYPLYLWHWPLLAYARIIDMTGHLEKLAVILISSVLAFITYKFVETPIRSGSYNKFKGIRLSRRLASSMLVLAVIGVSSYIGFLQPYHNSQSLRLISAAIGEWEFPGRMKLFRFGNSDFYSMDDQTAHTKKSGKLLFVGDSNMAQYYSNIEKLSHRSDKTIVFATDDGCPPIPNVHRSLPPQRYRLAEDVMAYAADPDVEAVVFGAAWIRYFGRESAFYHENENTGEKLYLKEPNGAMAAFDSMQKMLSRLRSMGKITYLILNIPFGDALDPKGMVNRSLHSESPFFTVERRELFQEELPELKSIDTALTTMAEKTDTAVIDPKKFLCSDGRCPSTTKDGAPIYKDGMHLRPSFVRDQITFLDRIIPKTPLQEH